MTLLCPARPQAVSINLSPNTVGQVTMSLMVNTPQPGDESYELWKKEHDEGLASLTCARGLALGCSASRGSG